MDAFDHVMDALDTWLSSEFGHLGLFSFDRVSRTITAIPRDGSGLMLALTQVEDGIRVNLGLGVTLIVPRDDPFDFSDVALPIRSLLESGIVLSIPLQPFGEPVLRYTLGYAGGTLSSKVPGHQYVDVTVAGWSRSDQRS